MAYACVVLFMIGVMFALHFIFGWSLEPMLLGYALSLLSQLGYRND